jgi:hypothetical protein
MTPEKVELPLSRRLLTERPDDLAEERGGFHQAE